MSSVNVAEKKCENIRIVTIDMSAELSTRFMKAKGQRRTNMVDNKNMGKLSLPEGLSIAPMFDIDETNEICDLLQSVFDNHIDPSIITMWGSICSSKVGVLVLLKILLGVSKKLHAYIVGFIDTELSNAYPFLKSTREIHELLSRSQLVIRHKHGGTGLHHHRDKSVVAASLSLGAELSAIDYVPWCWRLWKAHVKPFRVYVPNGHCVTHNGDMATKWTHGLPEGFGYPGVRYSINILFEVSDN